MVKGVKLLITGLENTGKTTMTSDITDGMVIAVDGKPYPYNVPHYEVREYLGVTEFKATLVEKVKSYKAKYGNLPKTVVLDTVTKLYELIYLWAEENYKGFDVHNAISKQTLLMNAMLDKLLIDKGINLVIVAHVQFDVNTSRYIVPATGKFKESGSWLSVVDEASYVHILGTERMVAHSDIKFPCRTTLCDMKTTRVDDYMINDHITQLEERADHKAKNSL
jgi:hypothetical protein